MLQLLHGNYRQLQVSLTVSCKLQNMTSEAFLILSAFSTKPEK